MNLGLDQYHDCFDVINARCVSSGIADYRAFLADVAQCLRPGGVFQSIEAEFQMYDEQFRPITARSEDDPVSNERGCFGSANILASNV